VRPSAIARLSPRQRQCLQGVAALKGSKEIAAELGVSHKTVDGYLGDAIALLGARDRRHAARLLVDYAHTATPEESPEDLSGVPSTHPVVTCGLHDVGAGAPAATEVRELGSIIAPIKDFALPARLPARREKGLQPNDLGPLHRLTLIVAATFIIAVAIAATVNLVDALTRFAGTAAALS